MIVSEAAALARLVRDLDLPQQRPAVVGVSGFGGAGKSTLAAALAAELPGAVVVSGDEFLTERPPTTRSDDWGAVDRSRLARQVLEPAHRGRAEKYQVLDPATGHLGPWLDLSHAPTLVVEGLGLFVPEVTDLFDLRVWLDVDLATATARGLWRDEHVHGNPQADLWYDVWGPNDADFHARFRPDLEADVLFRSP